MTETVITLSNGIRVVIDPMPELQSAAIGVWVRAGAMDEQSHENGVAHLLEHMAFKGTTRRSARDIAEEMEAVGGHLNAATSYPTTGYYARVLSQDLERGIDILSDIILDPALDEGELEREKDVVIQEIGEANDTPDDVLFELVQSLTYQDQPLGRPILGSEDDVRRHSPATLQGFLEDHYVSNNMIVSLSGGVGVEECTSVVERYFNALDTRSASGDRQRTMLTHGSEHEVRDLEQTHLAFAMPSVGVRDDDYFAMRLTSEILGGGMSSRLFQTIREKHGLAYSIYSYADSYDEIGTIGVYVGTDSDKAPEALELCLAEIGAMADKVTQTEVDRARAMLRSSMLMGLESPINRAERAASHLFTFGALISADEICTRIDAISPSDIIRCAGMLSDSKQKSLAIVGSADFDRLQGLIAR